MTTLVDLSHTVTDGLVTYKGLPAPVICDFLSREASKDHYGEGTSFQIGMIEMCSNTGTYIDTPFHRFEGGADLSDIDLSSVAGLDAIKVNIGTEVNEIGPEYFRDLPLAGRALLIETQWSRHWNTEQYYEGHPFLTEQAAVYIRDAGAVLVGIDTYNIDDVRGEHRPVHTVLLGSDILIVEHMNNLQGLPEKGFEFFAVPVKVKGMGTFPVRAFARLT